MLDETDASQRREATEADWFREPTRREHRIAAALFGGFGIFFSLLFIVLAGWWFRWVILALGIFSLVKGIDHLRKSCRVKA